MLEKPMVLTRSKQGCLTIRQPPDFDIPTRPRSIHTSIQKRTRASNSKDCLQSCCFAGDTTKLYGLSEEVLVLILEHLDATTLIRMSKTCRLFHRLCHSDVIWRHRCKVYFHDPSKLSLCRIIEGALFEPGLASPLNKRWTKTVINGNSSPQNFTQMKTEHFLSQVDFNLHTRWPEYSYLYVYELFCKASVLKNDHNFFRPVSQLKTSVIVWYLLSPDAPCSSVCQLTASQAKSIWSLTDDDLDKVNDDAEDNLFHHNYYDWESLYKLFLIKHGGMVQMQNYVLKRCFRNRQALEEHYQLSLHSSRQQKWYQFLDDRDSGNNKALKALTEHMPKVTHSYMLHQVTAMYIEGHLKGGFETVKAYAEFCGYFKTWLDDQSIKLWAPRQGDMLIQDYKDCLLYVNQELSSVAEELPITMNDFLSKAKPYIERLHEVWLWQNKKGPVYRKEHRPSNVITTHKCFKRFLERGNMSDFCQLKQFYVRKEIVVDWFKKNDWLHALLGDYCTRALRPAHMSADISQSHLPADPISFSVQRFMDTGLKSDFNKLRIKLSEIASLQLANLNRKSRQLQRAISRDLRTDDCIYFSEVDAPNFTDFLYPPHTNCFGRRQPFNSVEVVNLD